MGAPCPFLYAKKRAFLRALECILGYKSVIKSVRLSVDYLWTNCPF